MAFPNVGYEPRGGTWTLLECLANLKRKLPLNAALRKAKTQEEKTMLIAASNVITGFLKDQYRSEESLARWEWNPTSLTKNAPGLYGLAKSLDVDEDDKVGMSLARIARVNRQEHLFAYGLMEVSEMEALVPDSIVDSTMELHLPGLAYQRDHEDDGRLIIRILLCKAFLACAYNTSSHIVGESFMVVYSDQV